MSGLATLEDAFTSTLVDLHALRRTDLERPGLRYYTDKIDFAIGRLCDALEHGEPDPSQLAHDAYRTVLGLEQMLDCVDTENRQTRDKLDLTRGAVGDLLDVLEAIVMPGCGARGRPLVDEGSPKSGATRAWAGR